MPDDLKQTKLNGGLTRPMLDLLWHTIGMKRSNYRRTFSWWWNNDNHRNFYCVALGNAEDMAIIGALVERKLMTPGKIINDGAMRYFHATDSGITVAKCEYQAQKPWLRREASQCSTT